MGCVVHAFPAPTGDGAFAFCPCRNCTSSLTRDFSDRWFCLMRVFPPLPAPGAAQQPENLQCPTGVFEYSFQASRLEWSDAMYDIHGYTRGDIVPTIDVGMAHVDPRERTQAEHLWETLLTNEGPTASYHSIIDVHGRRHRVLTVVDRTTNNDKEITGIRGYITDITGPIHDDSQQLAADAVTRSIENRAIIEQAKGILMAVQSITADQAFLVLSRHSQNTNQKVTTIASNLIRASHDHTTLSATVRTMFPNPTT